MKKPLDSLLILTNGSIYAGHSFGAPVPKGHMHYGEICFNTSMTGYQEILTDPSYRRQIIVMSYPMIGNYGVTEADNESDKIQASGLIVRNYVDMGWQSALPASQRKKSLGEFLQDFQVPALEGIDTRKLVLEIRNHGVQHARIVTGLDSTKYTTELLQELVAAAPIEKMDLIAEVTAPQPYIYNPNDPYRYSIAVLDMGVKRSILKYLAQAGFRVHVFPASTPFAALQQAKCQAYFLSNGPGDPAQMTTLIETVARCRKTRLPIFGICLGHQLLALAEGLQSYKLKFGHRGANQPVKNNNTQRVEITAQNHGYAISTLPNRNVSGSGSGSGPLSTPTDTKKNNSNLLLQYMNLNDQSVEGFEDSQSPTSSPMICVQYHPEGAPGPHDAKHLFADFYEMVDQYYSTPTPTPSHSTRRVAHHIT